MRAVLRRDGLVRRPSTGVRPLSPEVRRSSSDERRPSAGIRRTSLGLRAVALPVGVLLLLGACGPSPEPDPSPSASPSSTAAIESDPLADLESSTWSVTNREELLDAPVSPEGDVDTSAWEKDGIDDATIRSIQEGIADYVATAFLDPESLRGDSAENSTAAA